jgi:hypothetical protein
MDESSRASRTVITQAAGRAGRDRGDDFRRLKSQVDQLLPPAPCLGCHVAVQRWLERHGEACAVMMDIGLTGQLGRMRETQHLLGEARAHARELNSEYSRLLDDVRQRVRAANQAARARAPRGR